MKTLLSLAFVVGVAAGAVAASPFFLRFEDPPVLIPGGSTTNFVLDEVAPSGATVRAEEIVLPSGTSATFPVFAAAPFGAGTTLGPHLTATLNLSANFKMRACANVTASVSRLDTLGGSTPLVEAAVVGIGVPRGNSQGTQGFAPITMESRLCRSNLQIGVGESIALSVTVTNTCPAGRHVFLAYDATSALSSIDLEPLTSDETLACQEKCASKKIKAGGRKAAAKVSCFAKAAARGEPPDLACLAKAEEKFGIAFARADAGSCFEIGDAPVIEAKTDSFVNDLVTELQTSAGPSKCTGSKLKAAGKKVGGRTGCFAKAAGKGVAVDPTCLQKYTNGFSAALQKAELKGDDCQTLGDATAIEAKIDSFSQDLVTELSTASSPSGAFLGEDGLFD